MDRDIKERTFDIGLRIIQLAAQLPETRTGKVLGYQVLRCGTSIGANVEEAVAAYSREDFAFKMSIALKEARETHYWLRLVRDAGVLKPNRLDSILGETEEIKKILGSIVSKMRGNSKIKSQK